MPFPSSPLLSSSRASPSSPGQTPPRRPSQCLPSSPPSPGRPLRQRSSRRLRSPPPRRWSPLPSPPSPINLLPSASSRRLRSPPPRRWSPLPSPTHDPLPGGTYDSYLTFNTPPSLSARIDKSHERVMPSIGAGLDAPQAHMRAQQGQLTQFAAGGGVPVTTTPADCPICLTPLAAPGATLTRCGHMFCTECLKEHLKSCKPSTCPCCRAPVLRTELVVVRSGLPERRFVAEEDTAAGQAAAPKHASQQAELHRVEDMARYAEEYAAQRYKTLCALSDGVEAESRRLKAAWRNEQAVLLERHQAAVRKAQRAMQDAQAEARSLRHAKGEVEDKKRELKEQLTAVKKRELELVLELTRLEERQQELGGEVVDLPQKKVREHENDRL